MCLQLSPVFSPLLIDCYLAIDFAVVASADVAVAVAAAIVAEVI